MMSRRSGGDKYTEKPELGQSIREGCAMKGKRMGMESPVHGLRKVSHNVRHVITHMANYKSMSSNNDAKY